MALVHLSAGPADDYAALRKVETLEDWRASDVSCYCEIEQANPTSLPHPAFAFTVVSEIERVPEVYGFPTHLPSVFLFRIIDAVLLPFHAIVIDGDKVLKLPSAEAMWMGFDLSRIEYVHPGNVLELPEPMVPWGRVAISMPWGGTQNYGHFVLDALPSVEYFFRHQIQSTHTFVVPSMKPWHRSHYNLLGVDPLQLRDTPQMFSEVVYTSAIDHFLHGPTAIYVDMVRRQLANLPAPTERYARKIYLARPDHGRKLASDPELRSRLQAEGFDIIETSAMAVPTQIERFRQADMVVAPTGAGLANLVYCRSGTVVVELVPQGMEALWVRHIAFFFGLRLTTYLCRSRQTFTDITATISKNEYDVDADRLMDLIKDLSRGLR